MPCIVWCGFLSLELFSAADRIKPSTKSYKTTRHLHNTFTEANFGQLFMTANTVVPFWWNVKCNQE